MKEAGYSKCDCNLSTRKADTGRLRDRGQTGLKENKTSLCGNAKDTIESEQF